MGLPRAELMRDVTLSFEGEKWVRPDMVEFARDHLAELGPDDAMWFQLRFGKSDALDGLIEADIHDAPDNWRDN